MSPAAPAALVCLDLQRGRAADLLNAGPTIDICRMVLEEARRRRWPVLHVHRREVTIEASRPLAGLEPLPVEPVYVRAGPSAFSHQAFAHAAYGLGGPLALIGLCLCDTVLATSFAAADRKLPVEIVIDAVFATPQEEDAVRRAIAMSVAPPSACRLVRAGELFQQEVAFAAANMP